MKNQSPFKKLRYVQAFKVLDYLSDSELIESRLTNTLIYECSIDLLRNRMARAYADCVLNDIPVPSNVMRCLDVIPQEKRYETLNLIRYFVVTDSKGFLIKQFRVLPGFLKSGFKKKLSADAISTGLSSKEEMLHYLGKIDATLATDARIVEHIFANHVVANGLSYEEVADVLRRHRLAEYGSFESLKESQANTLPKYVLVNANDFNSLANRDALKRLISINSHSIWVISFGDSASYGNGFGYDYQSWCKLKRVVIQGKNLAIVGNAFLSGWRELLQVKLPNSLVSSGSSFMSGCVNVEELDLPPNLTDHDEFFLFQLSKLRKLVVPKDTIRIKEGYMVHCNALQEIVLPANVVCVDKRFLDHSYGSARKVAITTVADSLTSRTLRKYATNNAETVSIIEIEPGKYELTIPCPYSRQSNGFFPGVFSCF